jgi:crossover junction endodeoxyribonuclease RuvC
LTIIGIDIGNMGAIALMDESGELVAIHDMPCLADGPKGRPSVNAPLLAQIVAHAGASRAYVEWVGPRPQEGAVGGFAFGRARGVVEGVCAALSLPVSFITPPVWKRLHAIPPGRDQKDLGRARAIALWPGKAGCSAAKPARACAEAALIAAAGIMKHERRHGNPESNASFSAN